MKVGLTLVHSMKGFRGSEWGGNWDMILHPGRMTVWTEQRVEKREWVWDPERSWPLTSGWNKKSQREFEFQVPRWQGRDQKARNRYWKGDARPHHCADVSISTVPEVMLFSQEFHMETELNKPGYFEQIKPRVSTHKPFQWENWVFGRHKVNVWDRSGPSRQDVGQTLMLSENSRWRQTCCP